MKKLLVVLGAVLVLGACGGDTDEPAPEVDDADNNTEETAADTDGDVGTYDADNGEELYATNSCIGCHGGDLSGASAPGLIGLSYDEVKAAIQEGPGTMPPNLVEDEDDLHDISAWVASHN